MMSRPSASGPGPEAPGTGLVTAHLHGLGYPSAQSRWRAVNVPHLVALGRAGARFEAGKLVEAIEKVA